MSHRIEHVKERETEVVLTRGNSIHLRPPTESSVTTPVIAMETESTVTADHLGQADLLHRQINTNPTDSKWYLQNKLPTVLLLGKTVQLEN